MLRRGVAPLVEVWEFDEDWPPCLEMVSDGGGVSPSVVTYSDSSSRYSGGGTCVMLAREGSRARAFLATILKDFVSVGAGLPPLFRGIVQKGY